LSIALHDLSPELLHSVADRVFLDIARSREKPANHRSYSTQTLIWPRKIYDISRVVWEAIRDVFPLPSDCLPRLRFSDPRPLIADALLNVNKMWHLIQLWEQANSGAIENRQIVLAVDAVAFRPRVTVNENEEVGGLKNLQQLEEIDIFQQFLTSPVDFAECLQNHEKDVYSALFALHIQTLNPVSSCAIIHVITDTKGKGNENIIASLHDLKNIL
jgi:hypothetical protein